MAELNQISDRLVLVIQCDVKNAEEFRALSLETINSTGAVII